MTPKGFGKLKNEGELYEFDRTETAGGSFDHFTLSGLGIGAFGREVVQENEGEAD
tara:strand:- start:899 stop:1063 length:165 start_codon:yes stop_codon:yes gene_type:complete